VSFSNRPSSSYDRPPDRGSIAIAIFAALILLTNVFLLVLASGGPHDWGGGWANLMVAFLLAPAANFVLFVIGIILAPWATSDIESERSYVLASIAVPMIACAIDFVLIVTGIVRH
jgi:hypothetical protein